MESPDPNTPKRQILLGLVTAYVVLGQAVGATVIEPIADSAYDDWAIPVLAGMFFSHGVLLAAWTSLGGRPSPWRLVAVMVLFVALMRHFSNPTLHDFTYPQRVFFITFMQTLYTSVVLIAGRFLGVELTRKESFGTSLNDTEEAGSDESETPPLVEPFPATSPESPWMQFSLRALIFWTTGLAMVFGTLHYLPEVIVRQVTEDLRGLILACLMLSAVSLIGIGAMWMTLGRRWGIARTIVLVACGAGAMGLLALMSLMEQTGDDLGILAFFCIAALALITMPLLVVRLAGYRLIWRRRTQL